MWRGVGRAVVCAVLAGLAGACAGSGQKADTTATLADPSLTKIEPQKPVRIAMLLPLGGFDQSAMIAKGLKQAGEMALFERDNPNVQLIVKDDKGSPEGAMTAAVEAIGEGAEIIIGPLTAKSTAAAAPVARASGVPVLTFSNDRQVAGDGVYLMSFLPEQEIERIVAFAAAQGKRRFAALVPGDAYGAAIEPAFRAAVARNGGTVATLEVYPTAGNAMLEPAKRLMETIKLSEESDLPVDALLLAGGQSVLPRVGPLIAFAGIDTSRVKLLGTGAWEYPNVGRETALAGGWYPGADPHGWRDFSQRFAKSFGTAPPRLATLAYDAVSLAVSLSGGPPGQRFTAAALTRPSGFNGVDGPMRFLPNGLPERGLAVLELQSFGAHVVSPAPSAFDTATVSSN